MTKIILIDDFMNYHNDLCGIYTLYKNSSFVLLVCGDRTSGDGAFAGSMKLENPKDWTAEEINKVLKPAYNFLISLQNNNSNKEVGFFLVLNGEELSAHFFIGKSDDTWLSLTSKPDGLDLSDGDMVIGLVHSHLGIEHFSDMDCFVISEMALGNISWTNIPHRRNNKNPVILDRMFFGLVYKDKSYHINAFIYKLTTELGLEVLNDNIYYSGNFYNFYQIFNFKFGFEIIRKTIL